MSESKKLDELAEEKNKLVDELDSKRRQLASSMFNRLITVVQIGKALHSAPEIENPNRDESIRLFTKYGWILTAPSNSSLPDVRAVAADMQVIEPCYGILRED